MNEVFLQYKKAIEELINNEEFVKFNNAIQKYQKIILIGNGGSNSIASHISQDLVKFRGKHAYSMSDPSMLTCFANDFGVDQMYRKYLEYFCDDKTLCIIISSSGESANIIESIKFCESKNIAYGLLTGFKKENKSHGIGKSALWHYNIPVKDYGIVECIHQIFLHGAI